MAITQINPIEIVDIFSASLDGSVGFEGSLAPLLFSSFFFLYLNFWYVEDL